MKLFRLSTLLYTGSLIALVACQPVTSRPVMPTLIEHKIPTLAAHAGGIKVGSDGALWFAETGAGQIGRITVDGVVTEYPVPTEDALDDTQGFVALGPDGAIWFNEDRANKLGRISPDGVVAEYDLPPGTAPIREMVAGPDKTLWVTALDANKIVKLSTDGMVLAEYPLPNADSRPAGMVAGPDGAFWFIENGANQIGRITLDGAITEYALPTEQSFPIRITVGPDNALWFTLYRANKIGRISLAGEITEYPVPGMQPVGITTGADGALWFTSYQSSEIGRLTTDGVLTKLSIPTYAAVPYHITAGPDGNLWFTEQQGNLIGQIKLPPGTVAQAPPSAPRKASVIAEWQIHYPQSIVFGSDSVWVPSRRSPNVTTRIDPATNQIVKVIEGTGNLAKSAVVVGDSVWVAGQWDDLAPIDVKTNIVGAKVPGNHPRIAYGFGSIWAVGHQGEPLDRVDPATSQIIASLPLTGTGSDRSEENEVWVAGPAVWVTSSNGALLKVDPATNSVSLRTTVDQVAEKAKAQTSVPAGKGSDFLWLSLEQGVVRIDPDTGVGLTLAPNISGALAVTDDAVWVGNFDGQLYRVNVATNKVDATYEFPAQMTYLATGFGSLWAASEVLDLVERLDIVP
jgi:virginiamycin B lyase